jgi:hypothetical protein
VKIPHEVETILISQLIQDPVRRVRTETLEYPGYRLAVHWLYHRMNMMRHNNECEHFASPVIPVPCQRIQHDLRKGLLLK